MFTHGVADGLSDSELAQAVQGNGAVPGWIALATLQQRNNLRSSAPVQAPQSTVAQGIVSKALGQAGVNPQQQQPMQGGITSQPQPQQAQGGITAQPQSFAKGGILALAGGTTSQNQSQQDSSSYYIPQFIQPVAATVDPYNPTIKPTATDLQSAQQQIAPMYGQQPDYAGQVDQIQQANRQSQQPLGGVGRTLTNLIGNIAANPGNPYAGWGKGLLANQDENDKLRQQNFANTLKSAEDTSKITEDQQRRAQAMANTVASFTEHQQSLAQAQDQLKMGVQMHNATAVQEANKEQNNQIANIAQDKLKLAENEGNPATVQGMIEDAERRNDKPAVQLLSSHLATLNAQRQTQEQQKSDVDQKREMAVQAQNQAFEMKKQAQSEAFEMGKQKQAQQFQSGLTNGTAGSPPIGQRFGDPDFMAGVARGEIAINPRDKDYKQISDQIKVLDPSWTGDRFANRQKYMQNLTSGPIGKTVTSLNNTLAHMGDLEDSSNAAGLNLVGTYSDTGNALSEAAKTAGSEIATTLKGSQATQGEVDSHISGFTGRTRGNRQAAINEDYKLIGGRIRSIAQQHSAATGEAFPVSQYLDGEAIQRLQSHGVDPFKIADEEAPNWMKSKSTPVAGVAPNSQPTNIKNPNPTGYIAGHRYGNLTYKGGDPNQRSSWQ